ncbi:LOW QUALITY PROTEIN: hypothetical protein TorRG33x02_206760 [Trema orientale]|uniref:Uncharacterized protein n=1 Tax=Trema orientale TaxID=63057 RepID=A0A2P5ED95_TREOI|nr:LOW QUALITY PROTEIN: hypothetical protein TorRG33x02_206760 [Trema orientale]
MNTKKGSLSINDYLLKIKSLVDQLASVGYHTTIKDHIDVIFNSLLSDYDTFVISVNSHFDLYTVTEFESLLLAQENIEMTLKDIDSATINLAHNNYTLKSNFLIFPGSRALFYFPAFNGGDHFHNHNGGGRDNFGGHSWNPYSTGGQSSFYGDRGYTNNKGSFNGGREILMESHCSNTGR